MRIHIDRPNTFINDFSFIADPQKSAVIFSYCEWSAPARAAHYFLMKSLESFPEIQLFLLDIDKPETFNYMKDNDMLSHGWGETYWIKEGKMIAYIKRYSFTVPEKSRLNHELFPDISKELINNHLQL